ncbi:MAG TPA: iron-sulfur cluster assembly accessory protein [Myxococcota bacterium]|jgi:iron-sulfur cluster insertion protein|nr:iron-sulfur cluster assembly accessory protein [Myxococcota bacterium]
MSTNVEDVGGTGAAAGATTTAGAGPVVTMTERAARNVKRIQQMEGAVGQALRVSVVPGGCSGFSHDLFFDEEARAGDHVFDYFGVTVRVDPRSMKLLAGTEIDFVEGIQGSGFALSNPQSKGSCGCGKSFNV